MLIRTSPGIKLSPGTVLPRKGGALRIVKLQGSRKGHLLYEAEVLASPAQPGLLKRLIAALKG